jgi:hypothetical protein
MPSSLAIAAYKSLTSPPEMVEHAPAGRDLGLVGLGKAELAARDVDHRGARGLRLI